MMKNHWLYLEPYTFIFHNDEKVVFYNSTNGSYLSYFFSNYSHLSYIISELERPENGYGVLLDDSLVVELYKIIEDLRNSYSGDCILISKNTQLPYIFMPKFRIMEKNMINIDSSSEAIKEKYGAEILNNLNEVTLFVDSDAILYGQYQDYPYCNQFIHSLHYKCENSIPDSVYLMLIKQLEKIGIGKLNIVLSHENTDFITRYSSILNTCEFTICIYVNYEYMDLIMQIEEINNFYLVINIHELSNLSKLKRDISKYRAREMTWNVIVRSTEELMAVHDFEEITIIPYYNGINNDFFEEFIYNTIETILEYPLDKQSIFRRQTLNENFFGKLYILPNGDTYANLNEASIGNINEDSLAKMIFLEMNHSSAWFKLRNEGKCKTCVNRYLCPSPSNYEFVIGKPNLCHIHP